MKDCGVLDLLIPELSATYDMTQNHYHFGTVWQYTLKVVEGVAPYLTLRMAALLHDIGKVKTRSIGKDGKVHLMMHEKASSDMAGKILRRLRFKKPFIK